jgi:integrase/recombinase XerC
MTTDTVSTTEIVAAPAAPVAFARQALLEHFLEGQDPKTRSEYGRALGRFIDFATAAYGLALPPRRVLEDWFLCLPDGGAANEVALRWRAELQKAYAPKTVNQRLSALRSVMKLAKLLGRVPWTLDVKNVPARDYRHASGMGVGGYRKLLAANDERHRDTPLGRRNRALLRLMFDLALRKGSVLSLRVCDVDAAEPDKGVVRPLVKRRGRHESTRDSRTLPEGTRKALAAWLEVHPLAPFSGPDPLFVGLDRASRFGRLSGKAVWEVVKELGEAAGVDAWPHLLRHTSCTHALDMTGGDVRKVQKFMGHASPATTMIYDDARRDHAGEIARLIAGRDD